MSLEDFNPDLQNSPQKLAPWWVARLKTPIPEADLGKAFILWGLKGRAPPSFWKVWKFPELPQKLSSDFPGSSLTVELNSFFQRFPKSFADFPENSPDFPGNSPDFPGGLPLSLPEVSKRGWRKGLGDCQGPKCSKTCSPELCPPAS